MDVTLLLVVVAPMVAITALLLWLAARADRLREASKHWPKASGIVEEAKVNHSGKGGHWPKVRYRYSVHGQQYSATRIGFVQENRTRADCEALVARYAPGTAVDVWYDPQRPGFSVLERGGNSNGLRIAAWIIGGLFAVTFMILVLNG